jgi:hypothetical protein
MNLTDTEILELTELCNALADGTLTDARRARLAEKLAASEEARRFYVRFASLSASLCQYAGEMQSEAPDAAPRLWQRPAFWWSLGPLAAAAAALAVFLVPDFSARETTVAAVELETQDYVAQVTGAKDCVWANAAAGLEPGAPVERGRRLELAQGVVEITFDCGAQVTLEGPATLDMNSAWDAALPQGTLSAVVPAEAIGFRISNPDVDVVDLGTEFSVVAKAGSATEVYVHKGKVQTIARDGEGHAQPALVLTADQSRQFGRGGSAEIRHATPAFKALVRQARKERAASKPEPSHAAPGVPAVAPAPVAKRFANALKFDGHFDKQLAAHGLTHNTPHTVAFWARVPAAAPLSAAGAMVAWSSGGGKGKGTTPIQITWNTDPAAGTLGALRTEFGHAAAVGATGLRDGRWHHVAVVFVPHGRGKLHVKQYVDGHLEGSSTPELPKHPREKIKAPASDVVWLGRRLSSPEHFHGELDEFVITDHALAPQQIKTLLDGGQPDSR